MNFGIQVLSVAISSMVVIGLIVEGDYDLSALKGFIRNRLADEPDFVPRVCGGPIRKVWLGHLEGFRLLSESGKQIDRTIVLIDSDSRDPNVVISALEAKRNSKAPYPFPVDLLGAVRMMEAWLLADNLALSEVLNTPVQPLPGNIEEIVNPKAELEHLLIMNGTIYTEEIAGGIAERTNPETVKNRCPWFDRLLQAV